MTAPDGGPASDADTSHADTSHADTSHADTSHDGVVPEGLLHPLLDSAGDVLRGKFNSGVL